MTKHVLLVDDDSEATLSLLRLLKAHLPEISFNAVTNSTGAEKLANELKPEVFVLDLVLDTRLGVESGFRVLSSITRDYPDARVIVLTGSSSLEHGIRAMELGASSFLAKPADPAHLAALITDAISQSELRTAYRNLSALDAFTLNKALVGNSAAIQEVRAQVEFFAQNNQPVLIYGETGTGKGVVASAIHRLGKRASGRFVRYQPSFAGADLVVSELFGHKKGSFTGASDDRNGLLAEAHGGTLFLDEIDELPAETQVSLLGALQECRFRPLGSNDELECDFRLVAATNRDLNQALTSGKLRQDFYHRVAHATIKLPPLRERRDDIPVLASHFLHHLQNKEQLNVYGISHDALEVLAKYKWPGNVRELEAVVEGAAYRAQYEDAREIGRRHLRLEAGAKASQADGSLDAQVEAFKLKLIEAALERNNGNQVQAALELEMDRSTMRRFLGRMGNR